MAIKSEGLQDFKNYLNKIVDECIESESGIYEGKIKEERLNGKIETFIINLKKVED